MSVVRVRPRSASRRSTAAIAMAIGTATGCAAQESGAFDPRGTSARQLDVLFWTMVVAGGAVFALVAVLLARAARGRSDGDEPGDRELASTRLVLGGGVVLPIVILVPLTVMMLVVGNRLSPRLGDAYDVTVIGHQFWWEVHYPDADVVTANEIHIPTGTTVRVRLESADVIHSFWVPQLAGKIDMIPGQSTEVLIDADEPGTYLGHCAEFCGVQHARMRFLVVAQRPADFEEWLAHQASDAATPSDASTRRGADTFAEVGCAACHTVRGTDALGTLGPDLSHVAGRSTLGAATVPNDRGQLGGWIADPQAVKPGNLMPPTPLTAEQLHDLIAYLESLE